MDENMNNNLESNEMTNFENNFEIESDGSALGDFLKASAPLVGAGIVIGIAVGDKVKAGFKWVGRKIKSIGEKKPEPEKEKDGKVIDGNYTEVEDTKKKK